MESLKKKKWFYLCARCGWSLLAGWRCTFRFEGHMDTGRHSDTLERRTDQRNPEDTLMEAKTEKCLLKTDE